MVTDLSKLDQVAGGGRNPSRSDEKRASLRLLAPLASTNCAKHTIYTDDTTIKPGTSISRVIAQGQGNFAIFRFSLEVKYLLKSSSQSVALIWSYFFRTNKQTP